MPDPRTHHLALTEPIRRRKNLALARLREAGSSADVEQVATTEVFLGDHGAAGGG